MTKFQETMRAEMKPDVYGGPGCDEVRPEWVVFAEGDKDSDTIEDLGMKAIHFPPGTKVVVLEPVCPDCGELREPIWPNPGKNMPLYTGPCRCGFDWDKWVLENFS